MGGCETGQAKTTSGYDLKAEHVIHTVGPVWKGGSNGEPKLLADCYRNALKEASQNSAKSIAFPSISTGAYGYPLEQAAEIAVNTVREELSRYPTIEKVIFCCFSERDLKVYEGLLSPEN